jgi:hypothetical protein
MHNWSQGGIVKLIALLILGVLFVAACEEGGAGNGGALSIPAVPNDIRRTEYSSVQNAVMLAMIDNGLGSITPVCAPTNDMSAFPDTTWRDGLRFAAPDTAGLLLSRHDLVKDDREPGYTDYMSDQFTRCKYLVKANGDVF